VLPSLLDFRPQDFGLPPFTDQIAGTVLLDPVWRLRGTVVRGFGRGSKASSETFTACVHQLTRTTCSLFADNTITGGMVAGLVCRSWGSRQPTWTAHRCTGSWQRPSRASTQAWRPSTALLGVCQMSVPQWPAAQHKPVTAISHHITGWASVGTSEAVYPQVMSIGFNPYYDNKVGCVLCMR
jgi:Riboflavin kinase